MKKIIATVLALSLVFGTCVLSFGTEVVETKATQSMNTAKVTFAYPNGGGPVSNQEIILNGETYQTNSKGQLIQEDGSLGTKPLPYGSYVPQVKVTGADGFKWNYTLLSQKVKISPTSHMPQLDYLNNIYLYRKFNLSVNVVDSKNVPIQNMLIEIYKDKKLAFASTVTTCIAGVIVFDWQEMPPSVSDPNLALNIGDQVVVKATYKGSDAGKYKTVEKPITISREDSNNYVKLVAYKPGEAHQIVTPNLFQKKRIPFVSENSVSETKGKVDLVYDLGMNVIHDPELSPSLKTEMFELKDSAGERIPVENAKLSYNHIYLTYDKEKTPVTVSYKADSEKYLVSSTDPLAKVSDFTDEAIDYDASKNDYREYEEEVFRLVNEERQSAGVPALEIDENLMEMARLKSQDMYFNAYFGHQSPAYGYWHEQNKKFGLFDYNVSGENLANVPLSKEGSAQQLSPKEAAQAAFTGWKFSPGHYANLLSREYTKTGIGFSKDGGFFTQVFAKSKNDVSVKIDVTPKQSYMGSVKSNTTGLMGRDITVTAIPNENHEFVAWLDENGTVIDGAGSTYTTTISGDIKWTAEFKPAAHHYQAIVKTIAYDENEIPQVMEEVGGTVSGGGIYLPGKAVNFNATANPGYQFYGWYFGEVKIPTVAGEPLPQVNKKTNAWTIYAGTDTQVTALFIKEEPKVTLRIEIDPKYGAVYGGLKNDDILAAIGATPDPSLPLGATGGALNPQGKTFDLPKKEGEELQLIFNLKSYDTENYKFLYWMDKDSGDELPDVNGGGYYTNSGFISIDKETARERTIVPVFSVARMEVKVSPSALSFGSVAGKGYYNKGSKVVLRAMPNNNAAFVEWADMALDNPDRTNPERVIASLNENLTVEPVFKEISKIEIELTTDPQDISKIGSVKEQSFENSTYRTLVATTKDTKYKFEGWYEGNILLSKSPTYSFYATSNKNITAKYKAIEAPYTLTVVATQGGKAISDKTKYFYNDIANLTAEAEEGFIFQGWYANGRELGKEVTLSTAITETIEIQASFAPEESFAVTFRDMDGRILSMQTVEKGGKAVPPATSRVGYEFIGWNVSDVNLNAITSNYDVIAQYKRTQTYEISVKNGSIVEPKEDGYFFGNLVTVVADKPLAGTNFSHWTKGSQVVSYDENYRFMVDGDVEVQAVYATNGVKPMPLIVLNNTGMMDGNKLSFSTQVTMADGFELVECGVVLSQKMNQTAGENELNLEAEGCLKAKSTMQSSTGQFLITKVEVGDNTTWHGRGYMIYKSQDTGELYTVYTANIVSQ